MVMTMFWLMVLLLVIGGCILWKYASITQKGSVAVVANSCPVLSADFLHEDARDGLGKRRWRSPRRHCPLGPSSSQFLPRFGKMNRVYPYVGTIQLLSAVVISRVPSC